MTSEPHRLPSDRAVEVEAKLRARAEQLKPTEQLRSSATPLGLCHGCATIVYAGDRLGMAGIHVFHRDCTPGAASGGAP